MATQVFEYINVKERALELGCNVPTGFALLPANFETAKCKDELIHENTVPTIRTLWRQKGISETKLEKEGIKFPYTQKNAFEWVAPTIFVSYSILSQNSYAITVALGVISNYLTEWFKSILGNKKVKLDIVVERVEGKEFTRIHYEGDVNGLNELSRTISGVRNYG